MSDILFQFPLRDRQYNLNYEDTLALFTDDAIAHPFDYSTRFLLESVLATRDRNLAEVAHYGQRVTALGRERFEARLTNCVDIGELGSDTGLAVFDNAPDQLVYAASRSPDQTPIGAFQARASLRRTHHVATLHDGRICVSHHGQAVFDGAERHVKGVCRSDGILMALCDQQALPPLQSFDGTVVSLASVWGDGYFHWLMEVLPKLLLIAKAGYRLDEIDLFLVRERVPALMEFLTRLGIPESKVYPWHLAPHIRARKLIVTSTLEQYDFSQQPVGLDIEPWISRIMHAHYSVPQGATRGRRIYIDREKAPFRKVINNAEVKAVLAAQGFEFFALEDLNLAQKQELFASADIVAGPAGAGFANLVFCHPGTQVLIIYQQGFESNCFWSLCNNNQLGHYHLMTTPSTRYYPSAQAKTINQNFLVDVELLQKTLDYMALDRTA
ncbi:glycosyltransferase family 61 protein [Pseudoduganella sp. LjRoot289]|uniref:glycosyltransferase family 61 protein n=1 Tax=Pseudoduganella sp. LjRoot289 TaxID=3342314 RepID=UPI003ECE63E9